MKIERVRSLGGLAMFILFTAGLLHADVTYSYTGLNYSTSFESFSGVVPFTTQDSISGSIVTAVPLAANLNLVEIAPQILTYAFSDGIFNWDPTNSCLSLQCPSSSFLISTDSAGAISEWSWDLIGQQQTMFNGQNVTVFGALYSYSCTASHFDACVQVPEGPDTAAVDVVHPFGGADIGEASSADAGSWSTLGAAPEPSMSFWAMGLLLSLSVVGFRVKRPSAQQ